MPAHEHGQGQGHLVRPAPSGLADLLEIVLDKGIVVDAYAEVSLLGIELLTVDARIVIASVDTYLRFAEATNRLDLYEHGGETLPDLVAEGVEKTTKAVASTVVEKKIERVVDKAEAVVDEVEDAVEDVAHTVSGAVETVVDKVSRRVRR